MKFSALREDILDAVQTVQYSASARGMMPILSGVKIEGGERVLEFHATDLESYTIGLCAANVERGGVCVANLKVLMELLRDSKDETIAVEVVGNEMILQGQKTMFRLYTMPAEDFPNVPDVDVPVLEDIVCREMISAVQRVSRAASKDEKRPTLMGILLEIEEEEMRMVSTDSYRLAINTMKGGFKAIEPGQYIIPASAMMNVAKVVGKVEKIRLYRDENRGQVRFEANGSSHIIRLIEGKFPKYDQFIPESLEKTVEVGKEEMLGALKRSSLVSTTVRVSLSQENITVISESKEVGEGRERLDASYSGEEMEIAFNSRFLEDGVVSIEGERIVIGISEPLKPGVIKEREGEGFLYIIMPIRI